MGAVSFIVLASSVVTIFDWGYNKAADRTSELQNKLDELTGLVRQDAQGLHDVLEHISDENLRTRYALADDCIMESARTCRLYLASGRQDELGQFLTAAVNLESSIFNIVRGMQGPGVTTGDIFTTIRKFHQNNQGNIRLDFSKIQKLLELGASVLGVSYRLRNKDPSGLREHLKSELADMEKRFYEVLADCRTHRDLPSELRELMRTNATVGNKDFVHTLYFHLAYKYTDELWFVMAYNPITGFDKHAVYGHTAHVFREGNKNVVVKAYLDASGFWNKDRTSNIINSVKGINQMGAHGTWRKVREIPYVPSEAAVFVVERHSNLRARWSDALNDSLVWYLSPHHTIAVLPP